MTSIQAEFRERPVGDLAEVCGVGDISATVHSRLPYFSARSSSRSRGPRGRGDTIAARKQLLGHGTAYALRCSGHEQDSRDATGTPYVGCAGWFNATDIFITPYTERSRISTSIEWQMNNA